MRRAVFILSGLALVATGVVLPGDPSGAHHRPNHGTTTTTTSSTTTSSTTTTTVPSGGHDPILFVHGWNSSGSVWDTMISRFQADGWTTSELHNWSYNTSQSNEITAEEIAAKVAQIRQDTGAAKVDIITHSMGGLSSRWYVKFDGGEQYVDEWVSLGGPNHGTDTAYLCPDTSCTEMRPGSNFLGTLNGGDESPGAVNYGTWWSPCDDVINPDESTIVEGAANTQTACIEHSDLYLDATVYGQVRDFVA
ncbi:MAG TPA: alpha/beta fold hydrolase [Acidimicrobiia bacterium]|nr:alpha/beta fold hydrolase [Acidimicrobiia bacterium]